MLVTVIVPTYNEEHSIGRCLVSLLRQYGIGEDEYEILVIDGRSSDRTAEIVLGFAGFGSRIRLIDNPRRYRFYAWNLGCRVARGEYVAFISAHAVYGPDYLRACLDALRRTGADAIGPVQSAVGFTMLGNAIAWCMTSPFGVGNARFRFAQREQEVDSVFSMFLRRETFERLGGYDERIAFDEEGEFNYRLRAAGGRIVVSPRIRAQYFVCETLRGLARQMFCYGYWRRFTRALQPRAVPWRVYVPPALIAGLIGSMALAFTPVREAAMVLPLLYAGYVGAGVVSALVRIGILGAACVAVVLPCMHFSYGLGFLRGLITRTQQVLVGTPQRSLAR